MPRSLAMVACLLLTPLLRAENSLGPGGEEPIREQEREHWSFRPLVRPAIPAIQDSTWVRNPIDAFVLYKLQEQSLQPMPEADRRTLIRRLCFDLIGLPPSPEQVEKFFSDRSPDAYDRLVERLLASPAYGERWAQHWLDLARYAETDGFEHDLRRPDAWKYRDWVINAFNTDLPFDEFVSLQLAGDEIRPDDPNALIATGFLLCGPDMPDINLQEERRHMVLNEITATVGSVFLGLQFGCAQCHNHKFDPISQADFYRLRSFFSNVDLFSKKPQGRVVRELDATAPASYLMIRGDFRRPGEPVEPAFPRIINYGDEAVPPPPPESQTTKRRTALAKWLTQPNQPLVTRVFVNRLWHYHFGKALVANTSDFGFLADEPVHVDLLDWLACELPRQGWSVKQMHRLIVTSAVYRSMSGPGSLETRPLWEALTAADPTNDWLGRRTPIRLDGESIRDAMLACSGQLSSITGGPGVMAPLPEEVRSTIRKDHWKTNDDPQQYSRRSIYLFVRRNLLFPMFSVFDKPDTVTSCSNRNASTTAPQALTLFNSELSLQLAHALAQRCIGATRTPAEAIRYCYEHTLSRAPDDEEFAAALSFLEQISGKTATPNLSPPAGVVSPESIAQLCLALFNTNEFVYID